MNFIYFILLIEFISSDISKAEYRFFQLYSDDNRFRSDRAFVELHDDLSLPLNNIKLGILRDNNLFSFANLKLKKRSLANENLPVWILNGVIDKNLIDNGNGNELIRNYDVMRELGAFAIYQESKTSSAVVYFDKRREFDGVINYEFLIEKLPVDMFDSAYDKTQYLFKQLGIFRRPGYKKHKIIHNPKKDPNSGVYDQDNLKTYQGHLYAGYPEVLVIVSWDVAQDWTRFEKKSNWYTTIVSRVITLFNGVDVLYSKLKKTKIEINLAGIIIGTHQKSFLFLDECYYHDWLDKKYDEGSRLHAPCINPIFRRFLSARKNKIPIDSYDVVIYLTREKLFNMNSIAKGKKNHLPLLGMSDVMYQLYECQVEDNEVILVGTVRNEKYYGDYPVIAHELAHLMSVEHDLPPYFTYDGNCCGNILKTTGEWCNKCITWSATSQDSFYSFFSSSNCCRFINKPRSLLPWGRHTMLTADEQCQCYGFKSTRQFRDAIKGFCNSHLQCKNVGGEFHTTGIPFDGTPCGNQKVCWQRKCQNEMNIFQDIHYTEEQKNLNYYEAIE